MDLGHWHWMCFESWRFSFGGSIRSCFDKATQMKQQRVVLTQLRQREKELSSALEPQVRPQMEIVVPAWSWGAVWLCSIWNVGQTDPLSCWFRIQYVCFEVIFCWRSCGFDRSSAGRWWGRVSVAKYGAALRDRPFWRRWMVRCMRLERSRRRLDQWVRFQSYGSDQRQMNRILMLYSMTVVNRNASVDFQAPEGTVYQDF